MTNVMPVIQLKNVTKRFGHFTAINSITLEVLPGEVVGFIGANGAGKTTTISMILGFLAASEGTIQLFGSQIQPSNAHVSHRRIGYASGDMELPSQLTGRQYLNFLRHQYERESDELYQSVLKRFSPQLDKKIHTLSRGNKQKIALTAAFVNDPDLILLDEPTSGLDPVMQEAFLDMIRECQKQGKTVFMSSHYLQEVMEICDRVVLMSGGKIVQDMQSAELSAQGGKQVHIKTGYQSTKPPKHAESVETEIADDLLTLRFVYKGEMGELQRWLAAVKLLTDVEISEYNLEETFKSLYQSEVTS